jgi:hypothetical protein
LRRNLALLAVSVLLCAPQFACASDSVDITEVKFAGISFSDLSGDVKQLLGDPVEAGPKCDGCIDIMDSWYVYDGLKIKFLVDQVFDFEVTSESHRLPSGIGVGSSIDEVVEAFGDPVIWDSGDKSIHTYSVTQKNGQRTAIKLDLIIRDNRVVGIETNHRSSDIPET